MYIRWALIDKMKIHSQKLKFFNWILVSGCCMHIRVSCFAYTSTNNYAALGPHSVCYNMKLHWFSEFSWLIYYSEIWNPIYKGFSKLIKGKCNFLKNYILQFEMRTFIEFWFWGLLVDIQWSDCDICHMSSV